VDEEKRVDERERMEALLRDPLKRRDGINAKAKR
jgi:hypothetical protein